MSDNQPYQTLQEVQQAHEELLERLVSDPALPAGTPADDDAEERVRLIAVMAPLKDFMSRAAAAGAYLHESRERRAAQGLLDYWASLCYGANLDLPRPLLAPHDPQLLPQLADADCPYVGLEAFGERNAANFFGRGERTQALLARLAQSRLAVVTGASGSGKSSLVLAGLLPALRAGGIPGSAAWVYPPALVPGTTPLAHLAAALWPDDAAGGEARLRERPGALPELLGERVHVLVVDQFEEVMTLRSEVNTQEFNTFVEALEALVETDVAAHRLVLTMRNDVDTQLAREYPEPYRRYAGAAFPLESMDSVQLREAIEAPARRVGLKFQEGVVDELIRSVIGEDAGLPLLQFSLMALWDRRHGNLVTREALRTVGSPRRAMTVAAEQLYEDLLPEQQRTAGQLFLALSRAGEGVTVFRNRVSRRRLHEVGEPKLVDRVVQRFEAARLLRVTHREDRDDDLVEVAHEALLRNWMLLQALFSERREERERRAFLRKQALKWREAGFDAAFLLNGLALRQAVGEVDPAGMSEVERSYLAKSVEHETQLEQRHAEESERRVLLAEQEVVAARRLGQSWRAVLGAVALAAVVLLAAAGLAVRGSQRAEAAARAQAEALIANGEAAKRGLINDANARVERAQREADDIKTVARAQADAAAAAASAARADQARAATQLQRSESARLMAEAERNIDNDAELAMFYASEAVQRDARLVPRVAPLIIQALRHRRAELRLRPELQGADSVLTLSPRGDRLLVATEQQVSEWDVVAGGKPLRSRSWPSAVGAVHQLAYVGDGGDVAIAGATGVWLWRAGAEPVPLEPKLQVGRMTVSDDGRLLAAVSRTGRALLVWSVADGRLRLNYKHAGEAPRMSNVMFDASGALVTALVPSAEKARLQALRFEPVGDGFAPEPRSLDGDACRGSEIVYAAGGMRMGVLTRSYLCVQDAAALSTDGDVEAQRQVAAVDDVILSPRGRYVVKLQRSTNEAIVDELSSGRSLRLQAAFDLEDKPTYENVISVSDDGERLAIKAQDGTVRVYGLGETRELVGRNGVLWVSDDDRWFIGRGTLAASRVYEVREVADGRVVSQFSLPSSAELPAFSLGRDGRWLQAQVHCDRAGAGAQTRRANATQGTQVLVYDLRQAQPAAVASPCAERILFSVDGLHVLADADGLSVYSAAAQRVVWRLANVPDPPEAVRPGLRAPGIGIVLGEGGRFMTRRVSGGQASVEVRRVAGDAAQLERAWQFPAPAGWTATLLGRGRALQVVPATGAGAAQLWDLRNPAPAAPPLSVALPALMATAAGSGVLAVRPAADSAWELRDIASGRSRGSLPAWLRVEPTHGLAYGSNDGRWQVRRLDAADRVLLEGEGQPERWQFDREGRVVALSFADNDRVRVYRLADGALQLESRFYDLRTARLTGGGGYLLTEDGRLVPADGVALVKQAGVAVATRFGNAERCDLLMDEAACRQLRKRPRGAGVSTSP